MNKIMIEALQKVAGCISQVAAHRFGLLVADTLMKVKEWEREWGNIPEQMTPILEPEVQKRIGLLIKGQAIKNPRKMEQAIAENMLNAAVEQVVSSLELSEEVPAEDPDDQ
jgi:hypothetical protein